MVLTPSHIFNRGIFRRVVKKRSTENFKAAPYVATLLSTSLWTFYGLLKPGGLLVVTVNGAGAVMQAIYVTLFLVYAPKDTKVIIALHLLLCASGCSYSNEHIRDHSFAIHRLRRLNWWPHWMWVFWQLLYLLLFSPFMETCAFLLLDFSVLV